jgi:hypothetical protein
MNNGGNKSGHFIRIISDNVSHCWALTIAVVVVGGTNQ